MELQKLVLPESEFEKAIILRDNLPVQELWNIEAEQKWRMDYYENFTKDQLMNGVPLFK